MADRIRIFIQEMMFMKITFHPDMKLFRIVCGEMEYGFAVNNAGQLINLHWGAPMLADEDYSPLIADRAVMTAAPHSYNSGEYRFGAPFDYAAPAIRVRFHDGAETLRLVYKSHEIAEDSLTVTIADSFYPLEVRLIYKTFADLPLISRSAVITNHCSGEVIFRSAMSATVQLPRGIDWRMTYFAGDWGAEYERQQSKLGQGRIVLETSYLTDAASHVIPFFALDEEGRSTETDGEVYFGALQYSGDFRIVVESQHTQSLKAQALLPE